MKTVQAGRVSEDNVDAQPGDAALIEGAVALAERWVGEASSVQADPAAERLAGVLKDPQGLPFTIGFVDGVMRPESRSAAAANLQRVAPLVPEFLPWYLRTAVRAGERLDDTRVDRPRVVRNQLVSAPVIAPKWPQHPYPPPLPSAWASGASRLYFWSRTRREDRVSSPPTQTSVHREMLTEQPRQAPRTNGNQSAAAFREP